MERPMRVFRRFERIQMRKELDSSRCDVCHSHRKKFKLPKLGIEVCEFCKGDYPNLEVIELQRNKPVYHHDVSLGKLVKC